MTMEHGSAAPEDIARVWRLMQRIPTCMLASRDGEKCVWRLMQRIPTCMLASRDGEKIRARPMGPTPREAENAIYFLTSADTHKDDEIEGDPHVCLTFAKPGDGKYLVVTGQARVLDDRLLVRELWNTAAEAWWEGPDDPRVRVIEVTPEDAQFWEGPHGLVGAVRMVMAAAGSMPPAMGDQRKVDLHGHA